MMTVKSSVAQSFTNFLIFARIVAYYPTSEPYKLYTVGLLKITSDSEYRFNRFVTQIQSEVSF